MSPHPPPSHSNIFDDDADRNQLMSQVSHENQ